MRAINFRLSRSPELGSLSPSVFSVPLNSSLPSETSVVKTTCLTVWLWDVSAVTPCDRVDHGREDLETAG